MYLLIQYYFFVFVFIIICNFNSLVCTDICFFSVETFNVKKSCMNYENKEYKQDLKIVH